MVFAEHWFLSLVGLFFLSLLIRPWRRLLFPPRPAPPMAEVGKATVNVTPDAYSHDFEFVGHAHWSDAFGLLPHTAQAKALAFVNSPDPICMDDAVKRIGRLVHKGQYWPRDRVVLYEVTLTDHQVQAISLHQPYRELV